jgi:hypothetical protein
VALSRAGEFLKRIAWSVGRGSSTEAAKQASGLEGQESSEETAMTVWIYIDTSKQIGDPDHLKVFCRSGHCPPMVRAA